MIDLKSAEEALFAITPDIPYEEWMKVGMAAQASGISLETFDRWSSGGCSYNRASTQNLWKSYREDKGINAGTLFYIAKRHGYPLDRSKEVQQPYDVDLTKLLQKLTTPNTNSRIDAQAIWDRSVAAQHDHPYIHRKNGSHEGVRVIATGDPLRILGEPMEHSLVIPVRRQDGTISTLQLITTGDVEARLKAAGRPTKLNLPGCSLDGWFIVGDHATGDRIFVCEGIGQAWACWRSTGQASVVAFGWGRVLKVAQQLQTIRPDSQLVLVPDKGKEQAAAEIAKELRCHVVNMPADWPHNSDVNDLSVRDGFDALKNLLDHPTGPAASHQNTHPLARYIDFDCKPRAPRWIIPGFIGHGVVIIAGAHGAGKTTALLPLSMVVAGLHAPDDPLAPKHWRHVVYIVEDIEQAQRILAGMVSYSTLSLPPDVVRERLRLVEACRLPPRDVAMVGATYRQQLTRTVDGIELLPLVVIDTKAAVLAMENENDNAEGSAAMAALKQGFEGLPTWIIGHVAKQDIGRADAAMLTLRGGSSFEADANQVLYLVKESDGTRYLVRGKTRFEAKWLELRIDSQDAHTDIEDEFGTVERVVMRWGIPRPADLPRHVEIARAKQEARLAHKEELLDQIIQLVDLAQKQGIPHNREGVKSNLKRNRNDVNGALDQLISERWLFEVEVPSEIRTNPSRRFFLIAFTAEERQSFLEDGVLPENKIGIPSSWRKHPSTIETGRIESSVSP